MPKKKPRRRKPWAVANPELSRAMQDLRRGSAAAPHLSRADKLTRAEAEREAVRDSAGDSA